MSLLPRVSSLQSLRLLPLSLPLRTYASLAPSSSSSSSDDVNAPYQVFDRNAKRLQKDRAASKEGGDRSRLVDYLRREVTERVLERFEVRELCPIFTEGDSGRGREEGGELSADGVVRWVFIASLEWGRE